MNEKRQFKHLGARLRAERPSPSSGLISAIVSRVPERVQHHPKASLRLALAAALAVALVTAVTATGAVGVASKQVSHAVVAVKNSVAPSKAPPKKPAAKPKAPAPKDHPCKHGCPPKPGSSGKTYKNPPIIRNVRTDPQDPGCPGTILIITGDNLEFVTTVLIGGEEQGPILRQNRHHIVVKIEKGAFGKVTVVGTQGSFTYKKEFISKKCHPKHT